MPALSTLVLNDNAAVARTFSIEASGNNNQGVFTWRQRASGFPLRYETITYSNKRGRGSPLLVHHFKLIKPITDNSSGVDRLISQCMLDARIYVPDTAPVADRQHFRAFITNLFAHTSIPNVVVDGESYY